ncbi:hypothetical protein SAMN05216404_11738 [Nitrosospira multiformis]|uniref:Uncharacterized protein n=1 Tax=Nitrosospira multiformis TaxID=1231 RepID=A0A1H8NPW3_9PROT|nr:hypothetical protein SAMN05216404_11738 [Nitrosospira multiformis]
MPCGQRAKIPALNPALITVSSDRNTGALWEELQAGPPDFFPYIPFLYTPLSYRRISTPSRFQLSTRALAHSQQFPSTLDDPLAIEFSQPSGPNLIQGLVDIRLEGCQLLLPELAPGLSYFWAASGREFTHDKICYHG